MERSEHIGRRRPRALGLVALLSWTAILGAAALRPGATVTAQGGLPGLEPSSDCTVLTHTDAHPPMVVLPEAGGANDPVLLSVRMMATCRGPVRPSHLVLVVDRGLLDPEDPSDMAARLAALPDELRIGSKDYVRLGRVDYDKLAWGRCPMSNDSDTIRRCMDGRLPGEAGTAEGLAAALADAILRIRSARATRYPPHENGIDPMEESIVLLAAEPAGDCVAAERSVREARDEGIDVDVLCAGGACQGGCLRSLAREGALHTNVDREWPQVASWIAHRMRSSELRIRRLTITEWVDEAFDVLPESLDAARVSFEPEQRRLQWNVEDVGRRFRYAYAVRPREEGLHTIRRHDEQGRRPPAKATWIDTRGRRGDFVLGNPTVRVLDSQPQRIQLPWLGRDLADTGLRPFGRP